MILRYLLTWERAQAALGMPLKYLQPHCLVWLRCAHCAHRSLDPLQHLQRQRLGVCPDLTSAQPKRPEGMHGVSCQAGSSPGSVCLHPVPALPCMDQQAAHSACPCPTGCWPGMGLHSGAWGMEVTHRSPHARWSHMGCADPVSNLLYGVAHVALSCIQGCGCVPMPSCPQPQATSLSPFHVYVSMPCPYPHAISLSPSHVCVPVLWPWQLPSSNKHYRNVQAEPGPSTAVQLHIPAPVRANPFHTCREPTALLPSGICQHQLRRCLISHVWRASPKPALSPWTGDDRTLPRCHPAVCSHLGLWQGTVPGTRRGQGQGHLTPDPGLGRGGGGGGQGDEKCWEWGNTSKNKPRLPWGQGCGAGGSTGGQFGGKALQFPGWESEPCASTLGH